MRKIMTKTEKKNRKIFICYLLLGLTILLYGIGIYNSLTSNKNIEVSNENLGNDINYRYELNGYSGLDITLNTLKTGESSAAYNTSKLQEAMNKVSEAGGGTIYLPSGTYYFGPGGYNSLNDKEDFAIKCRNNVHIKGKGTDENSNSYTVLKPLYDDPRANGGMDMFYFNNYKDSGFQSTGYDTSSVVDVSHYDANGKNVTWNNQTVYLINADFSDFVIDGESARGGIASAGGTYRTDGKGFMINLFSDCDWNNVVVKNVDATGFGVDCPLNSTIRNCKAINCGKAATQKDQGASGFGIGTGYSNEESLIIENSIAINNKKFGFFFEHQAKFSDTHYKATSSKGFVVSNSIAGGNMYDFGGLKAYDVSYENNVSVSNAGTYKVNGLKASDTKAGNYKYSTLTFNNDKVNLNKNIQPIYFSEYSSNTLAVNTKVYGMLTDVNSNDDAVRWAVDSGIIPISSTTKFGVNEPINRIETIKILYAYTGREYPISNISRVSEIKNYKTKISNIGFSDVNNTKYENELDNILWAYNKGVISQDKKFYPEDSCTRAQFITMLYRLEGSPIVRINSPFKDIKLNAWYYDAVLWAYENGIAKGVTTTEFAPEEKLTKLQLATFLYRYKNITSRNYKLKINNIGGNGYNIDYYSRLGNYTLTNPTRKGYTFIGWTGSNGVEPNINVNIKAGTTGNLSYTANWKPNLESIFIKEEAIVKAYKVGSKLNTKGLVIAGKYGDNNIAEIQNYEISPKILDKPGNQVITITYGGLKTSYEVTVADKTVSKISISKKPNKLDYYVGETVDTTGLELKVFYDDGTGNPIKEGYTISPKELTKAGPTKIIVSYKGKKTSFEVNVKSNEITDIKIEKYPTKLEYYVGEYLNTTGLIIKVKYENGIIKLIDSGYTVNVTKLNTAGETVVTVKYKEKSCKYTVNVKKENVTEIKIYELPKKISYYIGEKFSSNGLKIALIKDSGYKEVIETGFKLSTSENYIFKEKGIHTIKVHYGQLTTKFDIKIYDKNDKVLNLVKRPNKTNYVVGEKFSSKGILLELISPDGNHMKIDEYNISIEDGTALTEVGVKTVVVTYKEYTTTFDININKVKFLEINKISNKRIYKLGETFKLEDIAVIAQYEDGVKEKLDAQYKIDVEGGDEFTSPGEKTVTVTYGDVTSTFTINVQDSPIKAEVPKVNMFVPIIIVFGLLLLSLGIYVLKKDKMNNEIIKK